MIQRITTIALGRKFGLNADLVPLISALHNWSLSKFTNPNTNYYNRILLQKSITYTSPLPLPLPTT
jgi:hypothetical protein